MLQLETRPSMGRNGPSGRDLNTGHIPVPPLLALTAKGGTRDLTMLCFHGVRPPQLNEQCPSSPGLTTALNGRVVFVM